MDKAVETMDETSGTDPHAADPHEDPEQHLGEVIADPWADPAQEDWSDWIITAVN